MADLAYNLGSSRAEVYPHDPSTNQDIEDLGEGTIVTLWIPDSRKEDVDRNDTYRREVTSIIADAIEAAGG